MKTLIQLTAGVLLSVAVCPAQGAFTSIHIFGDGISTTTNNPTAGQYYYGLRQDNGRVWVEVLAQRLGLGANSVTNANWSNSPNNWSYYGQYSPNLATAINHFSKPADTNTALFVVWVNNADFVNDMATIYPSTNIVTWNNAINQSLSNHWNIITNLYYAKGARTLIMPNAVDITEIPAYDGLIMSAPATRNFIRQRIISFNTSFAGLLNQARALPGIVIYEPDFFSLLDNVLANASAYGLTNALYGGVSIDAMEDPALRNVAINGPGTNYIFWDATDPTAKFHEIMADQVLQQIAPVQISQVIAFTGSNRLDVVNMPVGLSGFVEGSTNLALAKWTTVTNVTGVTVAQSIFVPTPPPFSTNPPSKVVLSPIAPADQSLPPGGTPILTALEFYRLHFACAWQWP